MTATSRRTSFRRSLACLLLLPALPAAAEPLLALQFAELEHEALALRQVDIRIEQNAAGEHRLELQAGELALDAAGVVTDVSLQCRVRLTPGHVACEGGRLALTHAELGRLNGAVSFRYAFGRGLEHAELTGLGLAAGRVDLQVTGPGPGWVVTADMTAVEPGLLQPLLQQAGVVLPALSGRLDGRVRAAGWPLTEVAADLAVRELNYSGDSVAQDVDGDLQLTARRQNGDWQNELQLNLEAGELYLVPPLPGYQTPPGFYIAVARQPIRLDAVFGYAPAAGLVTVQDLNYHHPGVIRLNGAGRLRLGSDPGLQALAVTVPSVDLAQAFPVYLQPWLIDSSYNDIEPAGQVALEIGLDETGISALGLQFDDVDIRDPRDRFGIRGLTTDIQMTRARRHASRVSWERIDVYQLQLGEGAISLRSEDLSIRVTDWQDVALLDGTLNISELDLRDVGTAAFEMHLAGGVQAVSLPALTAALGWPELGGTLTGEFAGLNYRDGDLRMDGELLVRMFDGRVTIRELAVRDLFGNLPVFAADVDVRDIDLERLTETFAFGKITGRLGGHIHGLRLENWQPVAFDASLSTLDDGDTRHRISQKALNNLTQIGGGLSGALSRGFLRYFDEYSYGELGISCRLANGFCELGGVERYNDGYYLLTRGGLLPPWVEVRLAGSIIAWDALIAGFQQIAEGSVEID